MTMVMVQALFYRHLCLRFGSDSTFCSVAGLPGQMRRIGELLITDVVCDKWFRKEGIPNVLHQPEVGLLGKVS